MKIKTFVGCSILIFGFGIQAHAIFGIAVQSNGSSKLLRASQVPERCSAAKEFITTFEYLKDHKELGLSHQQMVKVAGEVAKGCTGAAARFVKVFEVLTKSQASTLSAMEIAIDIAQRPPVYGDTFVAVFTRSYSSDDLNLDYRTSLILADNLSTEYTGDPRIAAQDFVQLVNFCDSTKGMDYSKPQCGLIAAQVIKRAQNYDALVAGEFIKLYKFLTSQSGPSVPIMTALKIDENVIAQGPEAADNFIIAYNYSTGHSGLNQSAIRSLGVAEGVAKDSYMNLKPIEFKKSIEARLPASILDSQSAPTNH